MCRGACDVNVLCEERLAISTRCAERACDVNPLCEEGPVMSTTLHTERRWSRDVQSAGEAIEECAEGPAMATRCAKRGP